MVIALVGEANTPVPPLHEPGVLLFATTVTVAGPTLRYGPAMVAAGGSVMATLKVATTAGQLALAGMV